MALKQLVITGSGIKTFDHLTRENEAAIKQADLVLYLLNEPILSAWIQKIARLSVSLEDIYFSHKSRATAYQLIAREILNYASDYNNICVVIYGHPLLLSNAVSYLVECIDKSKINLKILPGISAFDCLIADLEFDPVAGCLQIEASELIHNAKTLNPHYHSILWQIGVINNHTTDEAFTDLQLLEHYLMTLYPKNHPCILYEAALYPHLPSTIIKTSLEELTRNKVSKLSTLYIPPVNNI